LIGDLAIRKDQAHLIDNIDCDENEGAEPDDEDDQHPQVKDHKNLVVDVTSENLHEFSLSDIVMPMVGYETRMPENKDLQ
jgi:hypothetical protein